MRLQPCELRRTLRPEFKLAKSSIDGDINRIKEAHALHAQLGTLLTEIHISKQECSGHMIEIDRMLDTVVCDESTGGPSPAPAALLKPTPRPTRELVPLLLALVVLGLAGGVAMACCCPDPLTDSPQLNEAQSLLIKAQEAQTRGKFAQAFDLWTTAVQQADVANRTPWIELEGQAYCAVELGMPDIVERVCDRMLTLRPADPHPHYLRGVGRERSGQVGPALDAYRVAFLQGCPRAARRILDLESQRK